MNVNTESAILWKFRAFIIPHHMRSCRHYNAEMRQRQKATFMKCRRLCNPQSTIAHVYAPEASCWDIVHRASRWEAKVLSVVCFRTASLSVLANARSLSCTLLVEPLSKDKGGTLHYACRWTQQSLGLQRESGQNRHSARTAVVHFRLLRFDNAIKGASCI